MNLSLSDRCYGKLLDKLQAGELKPGARLVNRTLAKEFGVSFAPVREAITRLTSEGLVQQVNGAGAFVRQFTMRDLEELYILREAIESCASAEAAHHASPHQLDGLDEICSQAWTLVEQLRERSGVTDAEIHNAWLDNEEKFHDHLLDASRNELLAKVLREHLTIQRVFGAVRGKTMLLTLEVSERTCLDRDRLMSAIRGRDAELARTIMAEMIRIGRRMVLEFLQKNPSPNIS